MPSFRATWVIVWSRMSIDRIAALSDMEPPGLDLILTRRLHVISGYQARKIMTIDLP